ncbi:MAG: folate-binding protein [Rhodanobacteraceae bacterium]
MTHIPVNNELLAIDGLDALAFAHAQFTSDVRSLGPGRWQWSAWLNPQGRTLHFFALLRPQPTRLLIWLARGGASDMAGALERFVMRMRVELHVLGDWASQMQASCPPGERGDSDAYALHARDDGYALAQPGPVPRATLLAPIAVGTRTYDNNAAMADVLAGLPFLVPSLAGQFLPQALGLERFDAIRFDKGCYPGQEIIARLHFRGGNKQSLVRLQLCGRDTVPTPGTRVLHGDQPVGTILHGANNEQGGSELLATMPATLLNSDRLIVSPDCPVSSISREFCSLSHGER